MSRIRSERSRRQRSSIDSFLLLLALSSHCHTTNARARRGKETARTEKEGETAAVRPTTLPAPQANRRGRPVGTKASRVTTSA